MSDATRDEIEARVLAWIRQSKPTADVETIRRADLIETRLLDSMQFLDFVYFLNEVCGVDVAPTIALENMRTLPGIVSFVEANRAAG